MQVQGWRGEAVVGGKRRAASPLLGVWSEWIRDVRLAGAPWWFPWAGLDLNSGQHRFPNTLFKPALVYLAKQHSRPASLYLHVLFVCWAQPPGDLEAIWIVSKVMIFLKKFFWIDSVTLLWTGSNSQAFIGTRAKPTMVSSSEVEGWPGKRFWWPQEGRTLVEWSAFSW